MKKYIEFTSVKCEVVCAFLSQHKTLHFIILSVAISVLALSNVQARSFESPWQEACGKAYLAKTHGDYEEALHYYKSALELMPVGTPQVVLVDMQLNVIDVLLACKRLSQAEAQLNQLSSTTQLSPIRGSLCEARYWRRVCKLYELKKEPLKQIPAREHLIHILSRTFGDSCNDAIEESLPLLSSLGLSKSWKEGDKVASQIEDLLKKPMNRSARIKCEQELLWYFNANALYVQQLALDGKAAEVINRIETLSKYNTHPHARLQLTLRIIMSGTTIKGFGAYRYTLWSPLNNILHAMSESSPPEKLSVDERKNYAELLFWRAISEVEEQRITDQIVKELQHSTELLEEMLSEPERSRSLLYIQTASTYARALALSARLTEADAILNRLKPEVKAFSTVPELYGILRARLVLAQQYKKRGDIVAAARQCDCLNNLLCKLTHCKDWERERISWDAQRNLILNQK